MDAATRKKLIDQYNDGYRVVAEALTGAKDEELDARPAPGKWTAREVVHHLADSEMMAAVRLRLLLAVDAPHIQGFDQDEFARRLFYDRPIEASLDAFKTRDGRLARSSGGCPRRTGRAAAFTPSTAAGIRPSAGWKSTDRTRTGTPNRYWSLGTLRESSLSNLVIE